ncbi:hypothetical protein [Desulfuromonas thiophila]|uniref:hypothetical protein n=1 Tax=Desulfuromonas thiophila TaxID=57664 RepID=UPI0029F597C0|nr:hypothetical protein [Desulfuromonas thiophila]
MDSDRNKSGLCQRHKCQLTQWENGKRTLPAPLQRMADGSYVVVREQQLRGAR